MCIGLALHITRIHALKFGSLLMMLSQVRVSMIGSNIVLSVCKKMAKWHRSCDSTNCQLLQALLQLTTFHVLLYLTTFKGPLGIDNFFAQLLLIFLYELLRF